MCVCVYVCVSSSRRLCVFCMSLLCVPVLSSSLWRVVCVYALCVCVCVCVAVCHLNANLVPIKRGIEGDKRDRQAGGQNNTTHTAPHTYSLFGTLTVTVTVTLTLALTLTLTLYSTHTLTHTHTLSLSLSLTLTLALSHCRSKIGVQNGTQLRTV